MTTRRFTQTIVLTASLVAAATAIACSDLFVPDFNNPLIEDLGANATRSQIASAATGVLVTSRVDYDDYIADIGMIGREVLNLDPSDPRFVGELLIGPLDPGSRAFGGDHWYEPYAAIRTANILLNALDLTESVTDAEKEALRGFAKTMQAFNFLLIINTRDTNGAAVDVNLDRDQLAPIVGKDAVFAHIVSLLDEARGHLQAGGASFPFDLPSGFDGFDTPTTFIQFNRALRARVDVYMGNFAQALQSLGESFFVPCGDFDRGVYFNYSTAAGDLANGIFEDPATADLRAHPSIRDVAEAQVGGGLDRRFQEKIFEAEPRTQQDHTSDLTFTVYAGPEAPIPIIRNEELILLRAEANIGLGNVTAAATDINCIRTQVGGLAARNDLTTANILDELLEQKFLSLIFEGGHRWVDARRYNRLDALPIDQPGDVVHERYPLQRDEELARGGS